MKFVRAIFLPSLLICLVAFLSARSHAGDDAQAFRNGEIIVELKPGASIDEVNTRNRTSTIQRIYGTNFYRLRIPPAKSEQKWLLRLGRDSDVLSAALNPLISNPFNVLARSTVGFPDGHARPGRPPSEYTSQPALFNLLHLSDVQLRSRGAGVVVAVIDTGVDRAHPDLVSHLWKDSRAVGEVADDGVDNDHDGFIDDTCGWDFVDNDNDPTEAADDASTTVAGHGTFIAGLLALIAPECRILPIRAFTADGMSNAFTVAAAIKYATDHGARVINLSFGSPKKSAILRDAIRYARQHGAVLVAAMGNENEDTDEKPQYPADLGGVMGVAAIDAESRKASFSNFGTGVCVDALGVQLASTYPGADGQSGDYAIWSGTSFAAPLTAAEAAIILAQEQRENARSIIEETATEIDQLNPAFSGKLGRGRINPLHALESLYTEQTPAGNYASLSLRRGPGESFAEGQAGITITAARQEFLITAHGLEVGADYRLIVDGKDVTPQDLMVSNFGGLALLFSNAPKASEGEMELRLRLPPELRPITRITHVELRAGDRLALQGDFGPVTGGAGPADQLLEKEAPLAPTGVLRKAGGKAQVVVEGGREALTIEADRLTPGAIYKVFADGMEVGFAVAQSAAAQTGFVRVEWTSADGRALPPLLQSIIKLQHIEVRDSSDQVILQGDFLPGGDDIGSLTATGCNSKTESRQHYSNPDKLRRRLRGDLNNIVLMAMRKEMGRRYA
ncbi:MAG: thermitase [Blastocatellia bacterium]